MYDQSAIDIFKDCFGGTQLKLFDEDDCMIPQYDIKDLDKIDGHEYVDLGLTSGLKWAACNIGANSPDDAGNYYAWGEIETKKDYFEEESITNGKKMRDISADPEYDAARAVWGGSWRMPTKKEIAELMKECKFYLAMKRTFLILTFFLCGLCCFGQTTITEEYFNKIDNAYKNGEWEQVLQYCDSIDYYKIDGLPYALLKAEALAGLGRLDEAINYLKSLENTDGIEPYYITNTLGNIYWLKDDLETAISHYETTIELRPSYARPYIYLGYIYQQLKQKDKAIEYFMGAIELFYVNYLLDEVEYYSRKIISELDLNYTYPYIYLERAFHEKGNYKDAMEISLFIDELCIQNEEDIQIYMLNIFHIGENAYFLHEYDSSKELFLVYLEMLEQNRDPMYDDECEANVYLGLISEHFKDKKEAKKYFQKAKEIDKERADYLLKYIADKIDN